MDLIKKKGNLKRLPSKCNFLSKKNKLISPN
jgi:hypothetical protein